MPPSYFYFYPERANISAADEKYPPRSSYENSELVDDILKEAEYPFSAKLKRK
jgi:hypothetical protein